MTAAALRRFGLTLGAATAVTFGFLLPRLRHRQIPLWPWAAGMLLVIAALVAPGLLRPIHRLWMGLGGMLGWVNTRVLLVLFYFLVLTPIGLLVRLIKRNRRDRRPDPRRTSYRMPSDSPSRERMERPY